MSDAIITAAGLRIVKLLVGRPPQSITGLLTDVGVTRTAITEQLNDLAAAGFVERQAQRLPGRGRPRFLYRATDAALVLLFAPFPAAQSIRWSASSRRACFAKLSCCETSVT
jgi:predicted transcriptional regulator